VVIGSEIIDRSIWIKGLSPEETIISGTIDLEDLSEGVVYFEKERKLYRLELGRKSGQDQK